MTEHEEKDQEEGLVHIEGCSEDDLRAVAMPGQIVFRLQNYDIWALNSDSFIFGIGHMGYRENLQLILENIDFRH